MKPKILFFTAISLVSMSISCNKLGNSETIDPIHAGLADWTEATHGKTDPNYDVVFPQDKINTLEITLTAENWAAIKADMKTKAGKDFGVGGNTQQQGAGGMGRGGISLAMTEVATSWPLIRYLTDDATYYAKYKSYVKDFNDNYFTTTKMNAIFDKNYDLISSAAMQELLHFWSKD